MLLTEAARSLALLVVATSAAATAVPSAVTQLGTRDDCDTANAVPFYRSWSGVSPGRRDHFYTTDYTEMNDTIVNNCNKFEGTMGLVFRNPTVSATLLYRVYNAPQADHFYTTSQDEAVNAIRTLGYVDEGTAGYVYECQVCASVPLYRMYNAGTVDHFYTTDEAERENAIAHDGYADEGIACYVLPDL